ncbi:MAG: imidazole glycerol phosphate synthase subunit HisF [Candidatus Gracilibacteria bacterium]|jgi:cyclase|nr:imidazole glycerol phosphate synthase subunit HisF [Candidatus Gracilibacteria bacterium]
MLKKRIIPCLDVKNGRVVKGTSFKNLRDAGSATELGKMYSESGADELVFLDISATNERRKTSLELAKEVSKEVFIPFAIGGGVQSLEDATNLIKQGADKISINSQAVKNPDLIGQIANRFGSQAVIIAIDATSNGDVYIKGGSEKTNLNAADWAKQAQDLGAGEILLTSIDQDGQKNGFDTDLINKVAKKISIPIIGSGGAGKKEHFLELFTKTPATGGLAASIFHFGEIAINDLKEYLIKCNIPIRYET